MVLSSIWNCFGAGSSSRAGNRAVAGGGIEIGNTGGSFSDSGHDIGTVAGLASELQVGSVLGVDARAGGWVWFYTLHQL